MEKKKWSGRSFLGRDGFFSYETTAPMLLHSRTASLVTISGLNGGKKPEDLPLYFRGS